MKTQIFIQENAFENVICKMSAILFRPQILFEFENEPQSNATIQEDINNM